MTDRGDTPTEHSTENAEDASQIAVCRNCGSRIDQVEWHPVATQLDDDEFHLYSFCSDECRNEWQTE